MPEKEMPNTEKTASLSKTGGQPQVEIIIGQAHWGRYHIYLWDPDGVTSQNVGSGLNVDQIPDQFVINRPVGSLDRWLLSWEVAVAPFQPAAGQQYSVTVKVTQDGAVVPGGQIVDQGPVNGGEYVYNFLRFIVS
jgi:hypothetical protein